MGYDCCQRKLGQCDTLFDKHHTVLEEKFWGDSSGHSSRPKHVWMAEGEREWLAKGERECSDIDCPKHVGMA